MLKTSIEESHCCGCGACAQACPKGALKMSADADGFLYPVLDAQKCVNCGLCEKVCPVNESSLKKLAFRRAEKSMAAVSKDKENARESSSGGAFSVLARAFAGNGECAFFGAEALGLFKVEHRAAKNIEGLAAFRKSKYIPSDTKNTFAEAKEILKSGGKVVYSGTPCQIAALKLFVGEKLWENLFCIDFSCHGTGSPFVFKKYISEIEKKSGKKARAFHFRAKARSFATYSSQSSKTIFEDGSETTRFKDPWFKAFVAAIFKRPSCQFCPFSRPERISDATIADFWGIERISKDWDSGRGVSLVLLNTDKARALAPRIRELADCGEFEFEECLKYNVPLREKVAPHPAAEKFRALIRQKDFSTAVEETLGKQSFLQRCSGLFLRLFPIRAQHKISAGSKKLTGSAKILISKILPRALFEKIMRKWAKLNGRKYVPENERKGDG